MTKVFDRLYLSARRPVIGEPMSRTRARPVVIAKTLVGFSPKEPRARLGRPTSAQMASDRACPGRSEGAASEARTSHTAAHIANPATTGRQTTAR